MLFTWNDAKNEQNRRKHGIGFEAAIGVFADPFCIYEPDRIVDGEQRMHVIGTTAFSLLLLVVCTTRDEEAGEHVRIISARKAKRNERKIYENSFLRA